jgi:ATP adenylyltransferase
MDFIWSPWRYAYVSSTRKNEACVFCVGESEPNAATDRERLILHRGRHCFVIMNLYPYTAGHVMVAPYAHLGHITDADQGQLTEMMALAQKSVRILGGLYRPEGFNIGMNLGECAGAGVRDHIHLHVVPRWCGDVNFMTSTGETRVLPEDLETTYRKLIAGFTRPQESSS